MLMKRLLRLDTFRALTQGHSWNLSKVMTTSYRNSPVEEKRQIFWEAYKLMWWQMPGSYFPDCFALPSLCSLPGGCITTLLPAVAGSCCLQGGNSCGIIYGSSQWEDSDLLCAIFCSCESVPWRQGHSVESWFSVWHRGRERWTGWVKIKAC